MKNKSREGLLESYRRGEHIGIGIWVGLVTQIPKKFRENGGTNLIRDGLYIV